MVMFFPLLLTRYYVQRVGFLLGLCFVSAFKVIVNVYLCANGGGGGSLGYV